MTSHRVLRTVCATAIAALLSVSAIALGGAFAPANAASTSLTGELLSNALIPARSEGTCNLDGPSTFTYTVSGPATGPYPGTFTETGSFTMTPAGPSGTPDIAVGSVTAFTAEYTIFDASGAKVVDGTKTLTPAEDANAVCALNPQFGTNGQVFVGFAAYSATIYDPATNTAVANDQGRSDVQLNFANNEQEPCVDCVGNQFSEAYQSQVFTPVTSTTTSTSTTVLPTTTTAAPSTTTTAPCKPGNGKGDKNQIHCGPPGKNR